MRPDDFDFRLPERLIAQAPLAERAASRLLHLPPGEGSPDDLHFSDFASLLAPGDLLVLNDTRVLPARLHGRKATGGRVEILLERIVDDHRALVQLRSSRAPGSGSVLEFGAVAATVEGRQDAFYRLRFAAPVARLLDDQGHVPLPPYIRRADEAADRDRYQTVFARTPGAVAAPTAGLHFDRGQLARLRSNGIDIRYLTLHVAAGTFLPLREEQLARGKLHSERLVVGRALIEAVGAARERGSRVIACGTTVARGLESAALGGELRPVDGETELFIMPGFRFRVVDALLTNFHLPRSSLLMLVGAFAGTERVLSAYAHAVEAGYRFFSYGDAMFCHRATQAAAA